MQSLFSFFIILIFTLLLPTNGSASSYERANRAEPNARVQTPRVYRLVYIVDDRGHWVLVRHDGSREISGPPPSNRIRK